ncbi:MAG: ATP-binding protein [Flavisolibacter sp.]
MEGTRYDTMLFAELYDMHPQAIVWMHPVRQGTGQQITDFEFGYSNEKGLRYLNMTKEQFYGYRLSNTPSLTEDLRKKFFEEMVMVYTSGNISESTVFNPALDKHARILRSKLRDGVLTVVQDITNERRIIKQLEDQSKQLRDQKTLLDNILEKSSNGISVIEVIRDQNGKVIDALTIMTNDAAVKYVGLPREIFISKKASEIQPAIKQSRYYGDCIKTLETGEAFTMQYFLEITGRWLELTVSKLDDHHLIFVFSDITPLKEVQLELEKAAVKLKSVFDSAQTGMFTFAPEYNDRGQIVDFRFIMVNATIAEYAAQPRESLEGHLGVAWFPGYLTNGEFDLYKRCFETGTPQRTELHYNFNGRDYFFDLQIIKIEGDQLLVCLTDQTTLRKSQLELEQTIHALKRSNAHLEDFAHAASHDMKEPIRKIMTFMSKLKFTLLPRMTESEINLFDRVENSATRMQLLIDDLLQFSHVSGDHRAHEMVDLKEKAEKVLADLELLVQEKNAQVIVNPLPVIKGNRRQLQQLLQNIIGNALKYSKPDQPPIITIDYRMVNSAEFAEYLPSVEEGTRFHFIEVSDNGIGFEPEYAEQIFEMFERLHGRSEYSGTGVGLAIAQKVVENHKGFIWAEGQPGKGASFKILFPAD